MPSGPIDNGQSMAVRVKTADAISVLAAAATATVATKLLLGEPVAEQILGSFVTYGGMMALSEELSDLVTPRIETLLGVRTSNECYAVRALIAGTVMSGVLMVTGVPFSVRAFAGAALGSVAGTYVWNMQMVRSGTVAPPGAGSSGF